MKFPHSNHHTSCIKYFPLWNVCCSGKWNPLHAGAGFRPINHAMKPFSLSPWGHVWKKALPGSTFPVMDTAGWTMPIDIPQVSSYQAGRVKCRGSSGKFGVVWVSGAWPEPYWSMKGCRISHHWRNVYSGVMWLKLGMAEPLSCSFSASIHSNALLSLILLIHWLLDFPSTLRHQVYCTSLQSNVH